MTSRSETPACSVGPRNLQTKGSSPIAVSEYLDVEVEYDDAGLSTDVEHEESGDEIQEPFDPALIDVQTRTPTIGLLLARLRRGTLDLNADFQRRAGIWNEVKQSRLIESILLRIPLPTLYAAESGDEDWIIVDGIQRLTAIARFVAPETVDVDSLRLDGLEYLRDYNGCTYEVLPSRLQTRIDETELVVHLIRQGTPEAVMFNIFARINTGGLPLTPQELRHALIKGPARDLLRDLAEGEEFLAATQRTIKSDRMADREMILRFFAFRLNEPENYSGDLDTFLRNGMKQLNLLSSSERDRLVAEFRMAMRVALDIFGEHAFRKTFHGQRQRYPVNKALFEAMSVNLAKLSGRELEVLISRRENVMEALRGLMGRDEFQYSISAATGNALTVERRFSFIEKMLREMVA